MKYQIIYFNKFFQKNQFNPQIAFHNIKCSYKSKILIKLFSYQSSLNHLYPQENNHPTNKNFKSH